MVWTKQKTKNLLNGLNYPFGLLVETLGEVIIICVAVLLTLFVTNKITLTLEKILELSFILAFIGVGFRSMGRDISEIAYSKRPKNKRKI